MAINGMCSIVRLNGEVGVFMKRDRFIEMCSDIEDALDYPLDEGYLSYLVPACIAVRDHGSFPVENYKG